MTDAAAAPLALSIDPAASAPPFEQLRRQVVEGVADGSLPPGTRLPTVRALAADLGLAVNTVAKAYRALESDGIIETRGRSGTFVAATGDASSQQAQLAAIAYADRVHRLGLDDAEALALVAAALGAKR
ncbi:DNA-binding transcriptional regulator YhcF (GntR family) [Agromyces terreus]|uniref:DNA-binding transcriptional regulator YhcF (GntR family) n=1 Tax=Agromyces terreus TaxID=424795 RepID=A0A9X2KAA8_9MICO|nr:GntR family transcriptional regulator [Agromyces terreus]MCP2370163.1 DNA-binding transcriptional regulator YhcF (GntR family) [Agromyces terreus]